MPYREGILNIYMYICYGSENTLIKSTAHSPSPASPKGNILDFEKAKQQLNYLGLTGFLNIAFVSIFELIAWGPKQKEKTNIHGSIVSY